MYPCCEISRVGARNVATCVAAKRNILFAISPHPTSANINDHLTTLSRDPPIRVNQNFKCSAIFAIFAHSGNCCELSEL